MIRSLLHFTFLLLASIRFAAGSIVVQDLGSVYSLQHTVTCGEKSYPVNAQISKEHYLKIKEDYGIVQKKIQQNLVTQLQSHADQMVARLKLPIQISITAEESRIGWEISAPGNVDRATLEKISMDLSSSVRPLQEKAVEAAGFASYEGSLISGKGSFGPFYEKIIRENTSALTPLSQALYSAAQISRLSSRDYYNLILSYVQEIPYQIPPMSMNKKTIGGFLPPIACLVENSGDCDTKSALFATLSRFTDKTSAILLTVPKAAGAHMIAAVRVDPLPSDVAVEYNGLKYVCCEPAGPAKLPLGQLDPDTIRFIPKALIISPN